MAEEAGDDDFGDVRGVGTAAGHTHHSEHQQRRERPNSNTRAKTESWTRRERKRDKHRERERDRSGGYVCFPLAFLRREECGFGL